MALGSTVYNVDIELADTDRQVYEALSIRAARHPSESEEYFAARLVAYALEYTEGLAFSPGGLSDPDEPAMTVRDLTGALLSWIEIGTPDPARLHRASKASPRVAVYIHKDPAQFLKRLEGERIHRAESIDLRALAPAFVSALAGRLERRTKLSLTVTAGELYVDIAGETLHGSMTPHSLQG